MRKERIIDYEKSLELDNSIYIDARTKEEYEEATIPGAVNIELLDFEERKLIGTIYNNQSPKKAKLKGVEIVSPKIPELIAEINELQKEYDNIIIFCSRGGLRSESLAEFSRLAGIEVYRLDGGYKNYRHYILNKLEDYQIKADLIVLHGNTGVGKTYILKEMERLGAYIIDLEGIANHRGSAFGSIGLKDAYNQKYFESLLWEELNKKDKAGRKIFVEAESKRIGNSVIPKFFYTEMKKGEDLILKADIEQRVENIFLEYIKDIKKDKEQFKRRVLESLTAIEKYIIKKAGKECYQNLIKLAKNGEFKELSKILLLNYYDPMYEHSQEKIDNYKAVINADDIKKAAAKILQLYKL